MEEYQYREFSSYNGLDRTALFFGIPLLAAVGLLVMGVFVMFLGMYFFSIAGFLFGLIVLPLAFFVRVITHNDDKALEMIALEMKYRSKRHLYKEYGNTLTFMPERFCRYEKTNEQRFWYW